MNTAFYSGLSGMSAYSGALNIVGNNLANLNTAGFKVSDVNFGDLVTRTFGGVATNGAGNPMQVGLGTLTNNISGVFSQGSIRTTADSTNVAMEGEGFFVVGTNADDRFYTRAGNFFLDDDGYMINPQGYYVLGYSQRDANNEIIASGALEQIQLANNLVSAPQQSTEFSLYMNLDNREEAVNNPTYTASTTIYDSLGASHVLTIAFTKTNDNPATWNALATCTGATIADPIGTVGTGVDVIFNDDGTLASVAGGGDLDINITAFDNGAADMNAADAVTWDVFDDNAVGLLTGYPIPSATTATTTDGYPPGYLTSIVIDGDGVVQGVFDNGQVEGLAQLAVSKFNNNKGLLRMGHNMYAETDASGTPSIGAAATGGRGNVIGSALESSNVDIAQEFTRMLVFQRGYQANSKIVTASDQVTQTAISLVR